MAVRDVLVRFRAADAGFRSNVDAMRASVERLHESTEQTAAWRNVSTSVLAAGAAITAGLGLATKAAVDWESAWAGVVKTVDASPEQFAVLEGQLKALARILPVSATEIASVAENAGQLGIKADDIAGFTETMIGLGVATNLTSTEASTAIAQIANVMGTSGDGIQRFASTLVALGNTSATTERDIASMAQRLAAAGKLVGFSETDVLAYSAALSSVGVEAEAGGTALSQTLMQVRNAVDAGGQGLQTIARTAGVSSADFARAFGEDAAGAVEQFVRGLGAVEAQGGSASRVLDSLGLSGVRQQSALLSLAGAEDLLARSLGTANTAWTANNALAAETARRYETTASQAQIALNQITQAGAELGNALLPVLAGVADTVGGTASAFADLPGPVKGIVTGMTAFAGAGLLAVGGAMKLAGGLAQTRLALNTLGEAFPRLGAKMGAVRWGRVAVGAAAATAAIIVLTSVMSAASDDAEKLLVSSEGVADGLSAIGKAGVGMAPAELQVKKLNEALGELYGTNTLRYYQNKITGVGDLLARGVRISENPIEKMGDGFLGSRNAAGLVVDEIAKIDAGLNGLATDGNLDEAQRAFRAYRDVAAESGVGVAKLADQFPTYRDQLSQTAGQLGVTQLSAEELGRWMAGEMPVSVRRAAAAHPELVSALDDSQRATVDTSAASQQLAEDLQGQAEATRAAAQAAVAASGSEVAWRQTLVETAAALKGVHKSTNAARTEIDLTTKAGRANQSTLNSLANVALSTASAMEKLPGGAEDANRVLAKTRSTFIAAAKSMGLTGEAARAMADDYGLVPESVTTKVKETGARSTKGKLKEVETAAESIPKRATVKVTQTGGNAVKDMLSSIGGTVRALDGMLATIHVRKTGGKALGGWVDDSPLRRSVGGKVYGPGTWTSDSVLTALSRDEYVIRAASATAFERAMPGFLAAINASGPQALAGRADGGGVGVQFAAPPMYPQPVIVTQQGAGTTLAPVFNNSGPNADELMGMIRAELKHTMRTTAVNNG